MWKFVAKNRSLEVRHAMKFINDQALAVEVAWRIGMFWRTWHFLGNVWVTPPILSVLTDDTTHVHARHGTA